MPTRTIFGLTLMLLLLPVYSVLTGCTVGYGYPAQPVYGYAYGNGYYANGYVGIIRHYLVRPVSRCEWPLERSASSR